jgi:hypothetical protein
MSQHDIEVSKLTRDLGFFPVSKPNPKKLTAEQIQSYNEEGYLTGFRVFGEAEARETRERSDRLLDRFIREGKGSYAIDRYQDRFRTIWDLATAPAILDVVEDVIGPNIVCWATHYFCKLPGDPRGVAWHQDCSYWPLTPSKTVTVWLAIDDVDRENGCMQVIPRSHLHGHLAFRESGAAEQNVLSQTIEGAELFGTPQDIEAVKRPPFAIPNIGSKVAPRARLHLPLRCARGNFAFCFPLVTCILVSLLLMFMLWLSRR